MDYVLGGIVLAIGMVLVAVIALNVAPEAHARVPRWARSPWLTIPATLLFVASFAFYGWQVLFGR